MEEEKGSGWQREDVKGISGLVPVKVEETVL